MTPGRHSFALLPALALCLCACPSSNKKEQTAASAIAQASAQAIATSSAKPEPTPYSGPTGTLSGTITVSGDPAPSVAHAYPKHCTEASATYGKLFRVGQDNTLADAVVAVTNYQGFVPPKEKAVPVTIRGCAINQRTIVLTDKQHLEVRNLDGRQSYIPYLQGAGATATRVAVPRGTAVKLYTRKPGRYWLRDQMGMSFMVADVFHFRYSTADVTGLDGRYSIDRIPTGKVTVSVMLPATKDMKHVTQTVTIKEGDNHLDLVLPFDAKNDTPAAPPPTPSATASATAKPN